MTEILLLVARTLVPADAEASRAWRRLARVAAGAELLCVERVCGDCGIEGAPFGVHRTRHAPCVWSKHRCFDQEGVLFVPSSGEAKRARARLCLELQRKVDGPAGGGLLRC